jgi:hypothetical protein
MKDMTDPRIDGLEADVRGLNSLVAPLETKVQAQKAEIQNLERRLVALENKMSDLLKRSEPREPWLGTQGGLPR